MNAVAERLYGDSIGTTAVNMVTATLHTEITRIEAVQRVDDANVQILHVPEGATPEDAHRIYHGPGGTILEAEAEGTGITLSPGDILRAVGSAADSHTVTVYAVTLAVQA